VRRAVGALVFAVGYAALTACGGGSPSMNGDAATELDARVTAVRAAVVARDAAGAEVALDELRHSVSRLRHDDALSDERAVDILAAAGDVDDQLVTITTTTTTTTATTTTTTAPPAPPAPPTVDDKGDKDDDKGKGKDEGKGGGKGKG
jgi:hypothetical protein